MAGPVTDPLIIQSLEGQAAATPAPSDAPAAPQPVTDPLIVKSLESQAAEPSYSGAILPFTRDAQGLHFDPNVGIFGAIKSAFTLPGDVYTGQTPISGPQGGPNPEMTTRSLGMAAMISPASVAMRAGELIPGEAFQRTVPSTAQLKAAGGAGFDAARASGLEINGDAVANMASGLQQSLQSNEGIIAKTAPKTFAILDELTAPPAGATATIPGISAARRGLSDISLEGGTEGLAARRAMAGLDDFMSSLDNSQLSPTNPGTASPEAVARTLADARGNYAAAMRSNAVNGSLDRANTGILDRAEARAEASHSGQNIDNAIRQRVATFLQSPPNLAGFSQPEINALNGVVAGGPVQNSARYVGNLFGGGGGLGHLLGMASGFGIGHALGGDAEAGAIGAMVPGSLGITAKALENSLARRSLSNADEIIRMNSPLYRAMQAQGLNLAPRGAANAAVIRGLLAPETNQPPQ